ncbi:hypothetical protein [Mycobacterium sp. ACS4331]|uniref:hypothetical protein n=1 Tax=Mycobacterium sp. ACS4331 TaxID=1834121 RepID=UPI0007FB9807|nr:hypothetical protein [Mycobacterium sp. ACS4331]OBF16343.1 hypothetical protein A5727_13720 [Mycobacterium sp. ACS4331]
MTGEIEYDGHSYSVADLVPPPPGITPDMMGPATVWVEQILAALIAAANGDDPKDIADLQKGYAERQALTKDALTKFPENEAKSQAQLQEVSKMAEQIPQMASGIAGGLAGAVGGALKPLTEMPQQLAQSIQGFLQQGMGDLGESAAEIGPEAFDAAAWDEMGGGAEGLEEAGGSGGGGGVGGTTPMSMLGPAAPPGASTTPTSARAGAIPSAPAAPAAPTAPVGGMGGYPMMPPGAMQGGGAGDKDDKTATKKVSVPSVKNGTPVTGRVSAPPTAPTVSKQVEGKTVATRRIVIPSDKNSGKAADEPTS